DGPVILPSRYGACRFRNKTLSRVGVSISKRGLMKRLVQIICAAFIFNTLTFAQNVPTTGTVQLNTIYSGADGKFEADPDTAVIRMDIAAQQDTSRAAFDHASAAAQRVRDVLKANGIDVKTAQVGLYQVQPVYDWKDPKHKV